MSMERRLSPAEWEVMEVLWKRNPLSSWKIVETLSNSQSWSPKTVKSFLGRLTKKGYLGYEKEANRYLYFPRVSRESCLTLEGETFLSRLFHGDVSSLILHFVDQDELEPEQILLLQSRLERRES